MPTVRTVALALGAVVLLVGCRDGDSAQDAVPPPPPETTTTTGAGTTVRDAGEVRQGSGRARTERREVPGFSRLVVRSSADVRVSVGGEPSVEVTTDDNLLELVTTEVRDGELVIAARGSYSTTIGVKVAVVTRSLDGVSLDGSGDVVADGVRATRFDASIRGSGDLTASGTAEELHVDVSGSGAARLFDLASTRTWVRVDGSGDAEVTTSRSLDASVRGSGSVVYGGTPSSVASAVSGSGQVRRR